MFLFIFSNDRSQREMDRLEHLSDIHDQFERFFRGGQVASFYAETTGRQSIFTQRAAKFFFWAAVQLAEEKPYIVIMSNAAEQMAKEAFEDEFWEDRAYKANSFRWEDASYVDGLVKGGKCGEARMVMDSLRELAGDEKWAKAFTIRQRTNPDVLNQKEIILSKCGKATASN
jgi:hypothetical protein